MQIWVVLAVLIPAGILAAVITRPQFATSMLLQADTLTALPVLLKTVDKEAYTANLRCNADTSSLQLEWINKEVSTTPSALVYQLEPPGWDTVIVGRIEAKGIYHFMLKKDPLKDVHLMLFDIAHHTKIDSVEF